VTVEMEREIVNGKRTSTLWFYLIEGMERRPLREVTWFFEEEEVSVGLVFMWRSLRRLREMKRVRRVWRYNIGGWKSRWLSVKMRLEKMIILFLCGKRALPLFQ